MPQDPKSKPSQQQAQEKAQEWIQSDEARRELKQILKRVKDTEAELAEARRIDPKALSDPFTL
jgi:hypothetical protein